MFKNRFGLVRSGWLIFVTCILFFIMQMALSLPGAYLYRKNLINAGSLNQFMEMGKYPWIELLMNGGGVLGGIIGSIIAWKFFNKRRIIELGLYINRNHLKEFGFGLLLGGLSMSLLFAVLVITGHVQLNGNLFTPQFTIYSLTFFLLFILVGFSEEIFFRGYIMRTMEERNNPKLLIYIMSALIFSLFHGMNPNVTLLGLINIGLVGLLFSYMYDVTKSLWMPIGYHITWNYFQGNVFGFPVSGTNPHGLYEINLINSGELFTGGSFGPEGGFLATVLIVLGVGATKFYCSRINN